MKAERNRSLLHFWPFRRKPKGPERVSDVNAWLRSQEGPENDPGSAYSRFGGHLSTADGIHFSVAAGGRTFSERERVRRVPRSRRPGPFESAFQARKGRELGDWKTVEVGLFGPAPTGDPYNAPPLGCWGDCVRAFEVPELAPYYDPYDSSSYRDRHIYIHREVPVELLNDFIAAHGGARRAQWPEPDERDVHRTGFYRNPSRVLRPNPAREPDENTAIYGQVGDVLDTHGFIVGDWYNLVLFDMARVIQALERGETLRPEDIEGYIRLERKGAEPYEVLFSASYPGWGPLLYDMGMSWSSGQPPGGAGIIPSALTVSESAKRIWLFYRTKRPDVDHLQYRKKWHRQAPYLDMMYWRDAPLPEYEALQAAGQHFTRETSELTGRDVGGELVEAGHDLFERFYRSGQQRRAR